ncbi:GNAT family N-acetyltransferase [Halolamina sp. CBA1230]|uniref:GNAT family N-acetyltransferase n=1 Tax=Halolamina sp. CBA1230 TaxID=1853690 RepID=UPI0013020719|nr:GNAT family N-acetyltransferase [Halolamina sp. CBA1230]QKY20621.1 GNAT family N-acetyltransferase [Halolamina sp. CBA1230]
MGEPSPEEATDQRYDVRWYDPDDRDDILSLFERVWGTDREADWLAHTYETNPYFDEPTMIVADAGGEVVGARPFVPFPMRADSADLVAAYLNNAMVHPDHRRRGLFSRMMERTVDALDEHGVSLLFNFANEKSAPGYREMGFDALGTGPRKSLRVQRPGRYVRDRLDTPLDPGVGAVANTVMRGYHAVRRLRRSVPEEWRVERRRGVPADELASLYDTRPPRSLHARREEPLYRWLEADPHWNHETFLASTDGSPAAAAVIRTRPGASPEIVDAVPSTFPAGGGAALLEAVLTEHRSAPAISVTGPVVNERLCRPSLLSAFGFLPSEHPLLSRFTAGEDTAFVHAFEDADLPDGFDVLDAENWRVRVR